MCLQILFCRNLRLTTSVHSQILVNDRRSRKQWYLDSSIDHSLSTISRWNLPLSLVMFPSCFHRYIFWYPVRQFFSKGFPCRKAPALARKNQSPQNPTGSCRWLDPCASEQSFRPLGWWKWASKACWKNGWTKSVNHPHLGCMKLKPLPGAGFWSLSFEDKKQLNYLVNRLNRAVRVYPGSKYTPYKPKYVD